MLNFVADAFSALYTLHFVTAAVLITWTTSYDPLLIPAISVNGIRVNFFFFNYMLLRQFCSPLEFYTYVYFIHQDYEKSFFIEYLYEHQLYVMACCSQPLYWCFVINQDSFCFMISNIFIFH